MRVVLPYTKPNGYVLGAIIRSGHLPVTVDVSGSDDAYWGLLRDLWASRETFVIIEHDIIVNPTTLDDLEACSSDWCACPYPYFNGHYPGLGCAKFTSAIQAQWPTVIDEIGQWSDSTHPAKHWCRLDGWLQNILSQKARLSVCSQHEPVRHWRRDDEVPFPSHGCVKRPEGVPA